MQLSWGRHVKMGAEATWTRCWTAQSSPARPPSPLRSARPCKRPPPWLGSRHCNESRLAPSSLLCVHQFSSLMLASTGRIKAQVHAQVLRLLDEPIAAALALIGDTPDVLRPAKADVPRAVVLFNIGGGSCDACFMEADEGVLEACPCLVALAHTC